MRGPRATLGAQLGRPAQRASHGASARGTARRHSARWRRCSVSRRWLSIGARETAGKRWLTGAETAARRDDDGRVARDGVGPGVGGFRPWRSWRRRHARGGREAGGEGEVTQLSGRAMRCPDSGFKPWHRRGTWRPHSSGTLPRGPGAARGV
jgi:hypothetical protein